MRIVDTYKIKISNRTSFLLALLINCSVYYCQNSNKSDSIQTSDSITINKLLKETEQLSLKLQGDSLIYINARKAILLSNTANYHLGKLKGKYILANWYARKGVYETAIKLYYESLNELKTSKNENYAARIHYNLGASLAYLKRFDNAGVHLNEAICIAELAKDSSMLIKIINAKAGLMVEKSNLLAAELEYKKALKFGESKKLLNVAYTYTGLAEIYLKTGKNSDAKLTADKALVIFEKKRNLIGICAIYELFGQYYKNAHRFNESLNNYQRALKIAVAINNVDFMKNNYNNLYQLYESHGDYKMAMTYYKKFTKINDSLFGLATQKNIDEMAVKYKTEKKDLLIKLLNKEATEKENKIKTARQNQKIFIIGSIIALTFLSSVTLIFFAYNRKRQKLKLELLEKENISNKLAKLRHQINPHFLFNTLNNLYVLNRIDPPKAGSLIAGLSDLLYYQLHETNEDKVLLTREIEYLENYLKLEKIRKDDFVFEFSYQEETLRNIYIEPLLLITLVENAIKHGVNVMEKGFINISISLIEKKLQFMIQNSKPKNYYVFDKASGIGLNLLKKRIEILYPNKHYLKLIDKPDIFIANLEIDII